MNRTLKILIALVIATGLVYWLVSRKPWNTLKGELKEFAIKDTAKVTRMFFADRHGNKVLLTRKGTGEWLVNNTQQADPDKVNLMLSTMHDLEVRNPISESQHNTVVGILATEGIKAEFYNGDDKIRTMYIGSSTPDQLGTYMLIEGSSTPFVIHITGFVGYLTPRFITEEKKWKSKVVFDIPANEIKAVRVDYPQHPEQSFSIENGGRPVLKHDQQPVAADVKFLKYYLGSFKGLYFEGYEPYYKPASVDSIHRLPPFCVVQVTKANGEQVKLEVHAKDVDRRTMEQYDNDSKKLIADPERYYAFINDDKDMVIIQHYSFGRLFRTLPEIVGMH